MKKKLIIVIPQIPSILAAIDHRVDSQNLIFYNPSSQKMSILFKKQKWIIPNIS